MPSYTATILCAGGLLLMLHIVSTYSALAQIIMDTGAMSSNPILEQELEEDLSPPQLGEELLRRTRESRLSNVPVNSKYRELNNNAKLRRRISINHDSETSMPAPFGVEDFADIDVGD